MEPIALPCKGVVIDDEGLWILLDASKVTDKQQKIITGHKIGRIGIVDYKGEF